MNAATVAAALPLLVLAAGALIVLAAASLRAAYPVTFALAVASLAAALASVAIAAPRAPQTIGAQIAIDGFTLFAIGLILATTLVVALVSYRPMREPEDDHGEYYFLLLLATGGSCVLAAAGAFAALFLGLELLSVSLFGMIAYRRRRALGTEASIKYLVLAGASSAALLFGMALVYGQTGSMELAAVLAAVKAGGATLVSAGAALIIVGIGFKLAVVPFHMWTPDVYDGAPAPVAGYIATVSKGAVAVLLMRLLGPAIASAGGALAWIIAVVAAASMFAGNLLALREDNVKRILAYSSIANLGYLLVAFLAVGPDSVRAVAFYLVAYFASALGAFAAVAALSGPDREADSLAAYRGIASTRPWTAGALTVMLLSLAGLPLTAGFIGKFVVLQAGAGAGQWALAVMIAVNSTISIFYYLRVVSTMYRGTGGAGADAVSAPATPTVPDAPAPCPLAGFSLAALTAVVLAVGIHPAPLMRLIERVAAP